jgi:hypothetical protein
VRRRGRKKDSKAHLPLRVRWPRGLPGSGETTGAFHPGQGVRITRDLFLLDVRVPIATPSLSHRTRLNTGASFFLNPFLFTCTSSFMRKSISVQKMRSLRVKNCAKEQPRTQKMSSRGYKQTPRTRRTRSRPAQGRTSGSTETPGGIQKTSSEAMTRPSMNDPVRSNECLALTEPTREKDQLMILKSLCQLLQTTMKIPEPPQTFSGHEYEDPEVFFDSCVQFFNESSTPERQRTAIASRYLEGDAASWWSAFKNLPISWDRFRTHLRMRYASTRILAKLTAKLYGEHQREDEEVVLFLERRFLLAQRLFPERKESDIVRLLLETLKPSIKIYLQCIRFDTLSELETIAARVQEDHEAILQMNDKPPEDFIPRKAPKQREIANRRATGQDTPLPICSFCSEGHLDCEYP